MISWETSGECGSDGASEVCGRVGVVGKTAWCGVQETKVTSVEAASKTRTLMPPSLCIANAEWRKSRENDDVSGPVGSLNML